MNAFTKFLLFVSLLLSVLCVSSNGANVNASDQVAKDFIRRYPDPSVIHWEGQQNFFSWQSGYIMFAMEEMWKVTGDEVYFDYIQKFVDLHVREDGSVPGFQNTALDNFLPGYSILFMFEETGLEKYKIAAQHVRDGFDTYPRASNGLFWHSSDDWARGQVWIDGVFMGQIFLARYAAVMEQPEDFVEVVKQMSLVIQKCQKANGLLLHGWDDTIQTDWADPQTGLAPEVWSEGLGWIAVLVAHVFDYLPDDNAGVSDLKLATIEICEGLLANVQEKTGMWCQVVDKPESDGNWAETSGTGMFIHLLQTAIDENWVDDATYRPVVRLAYEGLLKKQQINSEGYIDLLQCSSIGVQKSYDDYIAQPKEVSPFAAFGSYILGALSVEY